MPNTAALQHEFSTADSTAQTTGTAADAMVRMAIWRFGWVPVAFQSHLRCGPRGSFDRPGPIWQRPPDSVAAASVTKNGHPAHLTMGSDGGEDAWPGGGGRRHPSRFRGASAPWCRRARDSGAAPGYDRHAVGALRSATMLDGLRTWACAGLRHGHGHGHTHVVASSRRGHRGGTDGSVRLERCSLSGAGGIKRADVCPPEKA